MMFLILVFVVPFSRIRSDELNDMGYGLNRISPITLEGDMFQTPGYRTQDTAPMSTPRKKRNEIINKTFPVDQVPRQEEQPRSKSCNQSCPSQAEVQPSHLVDSYHHAQLMQITLQLEHQRIHKISTRLQCSMGSQLVWISPGILACRHCLANQYLQGSQDQCKHHLKRSHRQEEHKLHLHHHLGDQL